MYYVMYRNNGNWLKDGPFTEEEANLHIARCEFREKKIEHKLEETKEEIKTDENSNKEEEDDTLLDTGSNKKRYKGSKESPQI